MILASLNKTRFNALAGYARSPNLALISRELAGFASRDERVLGIVLLDLIDNDYSFVVLARDEMLRYRAIDVNSSLESVDAATNALFAAMEAAVGMADDAFHQGDASGAPVDFFAPLIAPDRQHSIFSVLSSKEKYTPAREIVQAMMRYHEDVDGRWIQNFQAAGFDARLWELYLWATFVELGFARISTAQVPDLILGNPLGRLAIEAATVNPPDHGDVPFPKTEADFIDYVENYLPIKLAGAIKSKFNHKPPYWDEPDTEGMSFCIAVQDFSGGGSMRFIVPAAIEYAFGVRHSRDDGKLKIQRLKSHRFGKKVARSGFFFEPGAENVSAIIVNPQGTLTKFNRLGYIAGFGNPDVEMVRTGIQRMDGDATNPMPRPFTHVVDRNYQESWVEGMVVIHNPHARIPLDPALIVGAAHEFLQEDGTIITLLPEFHPLFSQTMIRTRSARPPGARLNEPE